MGVKYMGVLYCWCPYGCPLLLFIAGALLLVSFIALGWVSIIWVSFIVVFIGHPLLVKYMGVLHCVLVSFIVGVLHHWCYAGRSHFLTGFPVTRYFPACHELTNFSYSQ